MTEETERVDPTMRDERWRRRRFSVYVDRAYAFGSNSLSGLLDIAGAVVMVGAVGLAVAWGLSADSGDAGQDRILAAVVGLAGVATSLMMFAMSRIITYVKACAVLLAKLSADRQA